MNYTADIEILTVEDMARMLEVTDRTIYRKVESGEIPHFRIGKKGSIRVLKSKFLNWIESQHN